MKTNKIEILTASKEQFLKKLPKNVLYDEKNKKLVYENNHKSVLIVEKVILKYLINDGVIDEKSFKLSNSVEEKDKEKNFSLLVFPNFVILLSEDNKILKFLFDGYEIIPKTKYSMFGVSDINNLCNIHPTEFTDNYQPIEEWKKQIDNLNDMRNRLKGAINAHTHR